MAFSAVKNIASVAGRMLAQCRHAAPPAEVSRGLLSAHRDVQLMSRPFTRSMWYLCSSSGNGSGRSGSSSSSDKSTGQLRPVWAQAARLRQPGKLCTCGCAGMHTKGDDQLAKFLQEEINYEEGSKQFPDIPSMHDFKLSQKGAVATLTKTQDGETVKVTFNLNHSVEEEPQDEKAEGDEETPSQLRSRPDFTVEITKEGQSALSLSCRYDVADWDEEAGEGGEPEEAGGPFLIDQVSIQDGEANDSTYSLGSEVMDGNLYELLMEMLEERGITDEFADKLSDLSSALEHKLYIDFLQKLQGIAKS